MGRRLHRKDRFQLSVAFCAAFSACVLQADTYLSLAIQSASACVDFADGVSIGGPHSAEDLLKARHQLRLLRQTHVFQLFWKHLNNRDILHKK